MKEQAIRDEIMKIGAKDIEAKKLERREKRILNRLRETHSKQQDAIEEIQQIFSIPNTDRSIHDKSCNIVTNESSIEYQPSDNLLNIKSVDANSRNQDPTLLISSKSHTMGENDQNNILTDGNILVEQHEEQTIIDIV